MEQPGHQRSDRADVHYWPSSHRSVTNRLGSAREHPSPTTSSRLQWLTRTYRIYTLDRSMLYIPRPCVTEMRVSPIQNKSSTEQFVGPWFVGDQV